MYAAAVAVAGAAALASRHARRRAEQESDAAKKRAARRSILRARKPSRHILLKSAKNGGGVDAAWLEALFPALKAAFDPQSGVTYKGVDWKISSYMELEDAFISGSHKVRPNTALLEVCRPLLDLCDEKFGAWYRRCYGLKRARPIRQHSFLSRYLPMKDQDQLKKHIDGKHLDGSVVVRLPSSCEGGQLRVWGTNQHRRTC